MKQKHLKIWIFLFLALLMGERSFAESCVAPPTGMIAWWPFDETAGTIADDRIGDHPGAHTNGPVPADGKVGGALRFDGSNDYVAVADSDLWTFGGDNFTIELWANFDVPGGGSIGHPGDIFIGHDDGPGTRNKWFFALGGGVLNFHLNGRSTGSRFFPRAPFSPTVGEWYHLAITRSGSVYTIYVNGIPAATTTDTRLIPNASAPLTIGQAEFLGFMNGRLDEVTIYDRALAQEELLAIADSGSEGKCKNLRIAPNIVGNGGSATITINGLALSDAVLVSLRKSGESDIEGFQVTMDPNGRLISTFDLQDAALGLWDLYIEFSNGDVISQTNALQIEDSSEESLAIDVIGFELIRPERAQTYWISYRNEGRNDIYGAHLFLGIPAGVSYRTGDAEDFSVHNEDTLLTGVVTKLAPGQNGFIPIVLRAPSNFSNIELRADIGMSLDKHIDIDERFASFPNSALSLLTNTSSPAASMIASAPISQSGQLGGRGYVHYFVITRPDGGREYQVGIELENGTIAWSFPELGVVVSPFISDGELLVGGQQYQVQHLYGVPPFSDELEMQQFGDDLQQRVQDWLQTPYCNPDTGDTSNPCVSCIGFVLRILYPGAYPDLPNGVPFTSQDPRGYSTKDLLKYLLQQTGLTQTELLAFFEGLQLPESTLKLLIILINSFDPNDKVGPIGSGELGYVSLRYPLSYLLRFENLETATAAAQEVLITDAIDTSLFDIDTAVLGPVSFGNSIANPPAGADTFSIDVDLRPESDLLVRVTGVVNKTSGTVTWRLTSIDPETGDFPADPLTGFLPPNVSPPEGDGSVILTVMPKVLPIGTEICNQASIVFDTNEPIVTPEWCNTLDNDAPISTVLALSSTQASTDFEVEWDGSDVGAGIRDFTIYVSEEGAPYSQWITDTSDTVGIFAGEDGKTYKFYSVARDETGNMEEAPSFPDSSTTVVLQSSTLGDFNGDDCVDRNDYSILITDIRNGEPNDPKHDINEDGIVNRADARTLVGLFTNPRGATCQ